MIRNKKQMFLVIGVFALVMLLGTVTYAFFNYTRTGVSNTIKVGRISFVTRELDTINLTNVFPISSSEATGENPNYGEVVIEIVGDTDYSGGIEYLVSAVDANIYTTEGQPVPISLDIKIDDDLGTENNNYFTVRDNTNTSIYKKIVGDTLVGDEMLLVGYIAPNTTGNIDGIDGTITIKAYLDKDKILISDTYDGTESDNMGTTNNQARNKTILTTTEWNALQQNGVSFKVKVEANEGIWVTGSLEEIMRKSAVMDNINSDYVDNTTPGINFGEVSSDTNGKGLYMRAGTENDPYPIMYYRGDIEDNNVVFANKCWKAVRTTDTGGVKLIYNGEKTYNKNALSENEYTIVTNPGNLQYDENEKAWIGTLEETVSYNDQREFSFSVPSDKNYIFLVYLLSGSNTSYISGRLLKNSSSIANASSYYHDPMLSNKTIGYLNSSDVLTFTYYGEGSSEEPSIYKIKMLYFDSSLGLGCNNYDDDSIINVNINGVNSNKFQFHGDNKWMSPTYIGYMYGDEYPIIINNLIDGDWTSGVLFANDITWDGTNYKLSGDITSTPDSTHYYSCNSSSIDGVCESIRYVFNSSGVYVQGVATKHLAYISLSNGQDIDDAIKKMNSNTNDSNAKIVIDTWYANNLLAYTDMLEDTIWCNDRSFSIESPNMFADSNHYSIYYDAHGRSNYATINDQKNQPTLSCQNKNDAFTVKNKNGNSKLIYPVALLTEDEIVFAGSKTGYSSSFYLKGSTSSWTLSPAMYNINGGAYMFMFNGVGTISDYVVNYSQGLRPAISIKPGQSIIKGTGTSTNPYVIE